MAGGSIQKRVRDGKTTFRAVAELGYDQAGKRLQKRGSFSLERDARKWLTTEMAAVSAGTAVSNHNQTLGEVLTYWLETHARLKSAKTYSLYEGIVRVHLMTALGRIKVQKLTARELQQFYADKAKAGTGTRTIQMCHLRLHAALEQARKHGIVSRNVADDAEPPTERKKPLVTWRVPEARQFLQTAETMNVYGPIWHVSLATGLRRGELLGLRWQDIDWERGLLKVRQSVGEVNGKIDKGPTKSPSALRDVRVHGDILERLDQHHTLQRQQRQVAGAAWKNEDLVFTTNKGGPIHASNLWKHYLRVIAKSGVKRIKIHGQRHTHATWALEEGADLGAVSKRLGHSKPSMTLTFYQEVTQRLDDEVMQKVHRKQLEEGKDA